MGARPPGTQGKGSSQGPCEERGKPVAGLSSSGGGPCAGSHLHRRLSPNSPTGGWLTASDARPAAREQQRAHHPRAGGSPVPQLLDGPRRSPGREGRSRAGAWQQQLTCQGGGQDVLAIRRELHKGHRGLSSSAWSTDVAGRPGCRGSPTTAQWSLPGVRTPPTTRASMRAAPAPGQERFRNKGPGARRPQEAGPSAPRATCPSGHREGLQGGRLLQGLPRPSCPADIAASSRAWSS